jgi:hypothetical protein
MQYAKYLDQIDVDYVAHVIDLMHESAILISIEMKARQKVQTLQSAKQIRWRTVVFPIVLMIIDIKIAIINKLEMFYIFTKLVNICKKSGYTQFGEILDQTSQ